MVWHQAMCRMAHITSPINSAMTAALPKPGASYAPALAKPSTNLLSIVAHLCWCCSMPPIVFKVGLDMLSHVIELFCALFDAQLI